MRGGGGRVAPGRVLEPMKAEGGFRVGRDVACWSLRDKEASMWWAGPGRVSEPKIAEEGLGEVEGMGYQLPWKLKQIHLGY